MIFHLNDITNRVGDWGLGVGFGSFQSYKSCFQVNNHLTKLLRVAKLCFQVNYY